jgi:protease IV
VYLDPLGLVYVDGFSYYRMFLKDAIDKLGVDVNVFRAGTFKSYTDQFSRSDMAPSRARGEFRLARRALERPTAERRDARALACRRTRSTNTSRRARRRSRLQRRCGEIGAAARLGDRAQEPPQLADELKTLVGEDADTHSFNRSA